MTIVELVEKKGFIVTAELSPPKGIHCESTLKTAEDMSQFVDAVNITDGQSAVMRMSSLAFSHFLIDKGIEPVFQLTCRDRNRIALQAEMLSAFSLGIRNVLCLTGDHIGLGDHPDAKPVFDLDSVSLLWAAQKLNEGYDLHGNALKGSTTLCAGGVVNPNASVIEPQLLKMRRKVEAGARFFQAQAVFETSKLIPFAEAAKGMGVPILMGVLLVKTPSMARLIRDRVSGICIPETFVNELESSRDPIQSGIKMAARLVGEAKSISQGVHIMTLGSDDLIKEILNQAGI